MSLVARHVVYHVLWGRLRWLGRRAQARAIEYWLAHDPATREGIEEGIADADAGRTYRFRGVSRFPDPPTAGWQLDDPQQPAGWHHDGTRWRLNRDGGWFVDRYGFWRYTKPGEVGWLENPDGSWRYDHARAEARREP